MVRETGSLGWIAVLNRMVRLSLIEMVVLDQKLEKREGIHGGEGPLGSTKVSKGRVCWPLRAEW